MDSKQESQAPKKKRVAKKAKAEKVIPAEKPDEDLAPRVMSLHGELFWEYRAKLAEYEKTLLERNVALKELNRELSDPKYKKVVELITAEEEARKSLKQQASFLRGVQVKAATKLGISIDVFLKECLIDHETGVVRILE